MHGLPRLPEGRGVLRNPKVNLRMKKKKPFKLHLPPVFMVTGKVNWGSSPHPAEN